MTVTCGEFLVLMAGLVLCLAGWIVEWWVHRHDSARAHNAPEEWRHHE